MKKEKEKTENWEPFGTKLQAETAMDLRVYCAKNKKQVRHVTDTALKLYLAREVNK
jgi:hypothetical protein